jgi:hypothetical protein
MLINVSLTTDVLALVGRYLSVGSLRVAGSLRVKSLIVNVQQAAPWERSGRPLGASALRDRARS